MSVRPKRPCSTPGCPELIDGGNSKCPTHQQQPKLPYPQQTKRLITANQKGYTYRWQLYTKWYKKHNPLCIACKANDYITLTKDVDHIIPVTGPDDPLFWDENNHQPLCHSCHSKKTAQERKAKYKT